MNLTLNNDGFFITEPLLAPDECDAALESLAGVQFDKAGTRNLLGLAWCGELARVIRSHPAVAPVLPDGAVAVQCTLFDKSAERNWLVGLHQDLSIPVARKLEHPEISGWSEKQGIVFAQPPASVLAGLVAVRLHLDDCGANDGPLRVVPGSHRFGRMSDDEARAQREQRGEVTCCVPRGAALVMRPLLLHASSKASATSRRRVLHYLIGPPRLPFGLEWERVI